MANVAWLHATVRGQFAWLHEASDIELRKRQVGTIARVAIENSRAARDYDGAILGRVTA